MQPSSFLFFHLATCWDGIENGDEEGVDCGGSCPWNCGRKWAEKKKVGQKTQNVFFIIIMWGVSELFNIYFPNDLLKR